jgi:hypothetical protein
MTIPEDADDPIESYLDEVFTAMRGSPRTIRRVLREVEDHLRDAAAEAQRAGMSDDEAARLAIARFGPARSLASASTAERPLRVSDIGRQLLVLCCLLAGIGLVSIGASGVVAAGMGKAFGARFVAGDLPGVTYTADRCADFARLVPHATTCAQAAAIHHYGEVVEYRLAAGVAGLFALVVWRRLRRRWPPTAHGLLLQRALMPALAAALFAMASLLLAVQAANALTVGRNAGAGQWLSGAVVSIVVAVASGGSLVRSLREAPV